MKGIYALIVHLEDDKNITVGKLGKMDFKRGYYVYIGSALNSLEGRINRHRRKEKKLRWHIDYLLEKAKVVDVLYKETEERLECESARKLEERFPGTKSFGSSDCSCKSHLFYSERDPGDRLGGLLGMHS